MFLGSADGLCSHLFGNADCFVGYALDNTTGLGKVRASAHEVDVNITSCLTSFVYAPISHQRMAIIKLESLDSLPNNERLTTSAVTGRKYVGKIRCILAGWSLDVFARILFHVVAQQPILWAQETHGK